MHFFSIVFNLCGPLTGGFNWCKDSWQDSPWSDFRVRFLLVEGQGTCADQSALFQIIEQVEIRCLGETALNRLQAEGFFLQIGDGLRVVTVGQ